MKTLLKTLLKIVAGIADGTIGSDITALLDSNKDGKVTLKEAWQNRHKLINLSIGQWVKIVVSTGISIFAVLK